MRCDRTEWRTEVGLTSEGPNGLVQPQRILEWMQEAAANASTIGGYPAERYKAMGAAWFIRELEIAVDRPIRYGEKIAVETWISQIRRFRTDREYRIARLVDGGREIVARGRVDWTLLALDRATMKVRPLRFDEEMLASFPMAKERVFEPGDLLEWGEEPAIPPDLAADTRLARPSELDSNGHVNHVVYLTWLEDQVRLALGDALELERVRIQFIADVRRGDTVSTSGWKGSDRIQQRITRRGEPIARAVMVRRPADPIPFDTPPPG